MNEGYIEKDSDWDDPGWTRIPNNILRDPNLSLEAKGLIGYLASHSTNYKIRLSSLQAAVGTGRDRLRRILKEIEDAGFLTRHATWQVVDGMNRRGLSRYVLHCSPRSAHVTESQSVEARPTESQVTESQVTESQGTGIQGDLRRLRFKKTKEEEDQRDIYPDDSKFRVSMTEPGPGFEDFYSAYPKKVDRKAAERAWTKAVTRDKADPHQVVAAAQRYAALTKTRDRQYIKNPATWLNAGSYLDETPTPRPQRSDGRQMPRGYDEYGILRDPKTGAAIER